MEDPDIWFPPSPPSGVPASALQLPPPLPSTVNFNFSYFINDRSFRITVPSVLAIFMLMIFCCICKKLKARCNGLCAASASSSTAASVLQDDDINELALELPSSSRASPFPSRPSPPPGSGIVTCETITTHINITEIHIR